MGVFEKKCILSNFQEKERELDAKNIYANRMVKPSQKKDAESGAKRKGNNCHTIQYANRTGRNDRALEHV